MINPLKLLARKYILTTEEEALVRAKELKREGIYSTINNTTEHVDSYADAFSSMADVCALLSTIYSRGLNDFTTVSVKMSALGMDEDLILRVVKMSESLGVEVQFDVEGPETHEFYYRMVHSYNLNGAIQAKSPPIFLPTKSPRIVKGAYKVKLHKGRVEIFWQMMEWVEEYLQVWDEVVIVGTHDHFIIESLLAYKDRIELQYLHGVKEKQFRRYKEMGFKVREYIPYGDDWYPYVVRRIKENPWRIFKL